MAPFGLNMLDTLDTEQDENEPDDLDYGALLRGGAPSDQPSDIDRLLNEADKQAGGSDEAEGAGQQNGPGDDSPDEQGRTMPDYTPDASGNSHEDDELARQQFEGV